MIDTQIERQMDITYDAVTDGEEGHVGGEGGDEDGGAGGQGTQDTRRPWAHRHTYRQIHSNIDRYSDKKKLHKQIQKYIDAYFILTNKSPFKDYLKQYMGGRNLLVKCTCTIICKVYDLDYM